MLRARPHAEAVRHLETIPAARETVFFSGETRAQGEQRGWSAGVCATRYSRGRGSRLPNRRTSRAIIPRKIPPADRGHREKMNTRTGNLSRGTIAITDYPLRGNHLPYFPSTNSQVSEVYPRVLPRVISSFVARKINLLRNNPKRNLRGGQLRIASYSSEEIRVITYYNFSKYT